MLVFENIVDPSVQDIIEDHVLHERVIDWRLMADPEDLSKHTFKNHIVHNMKILSSLYNMIGKAKIIDNIYALLPPNTGTWAIDRAFMEFLPKGLVQEYTQEKIFTLNKEADSGGVESIGSDPIASYVVTYFINTSNAVIHCSDEETLPHCIKGSAAVFDKNQSFCIDGTHALSPTALIMFGIVDLQTSKDEVRNMM